MGFFSDMFSDPFSGGILGAISGSEDVYGTKPQPVPTPSPTDILTENLSANLAAQPQMGQFQDEQQRQLLAELERASPGITAGLAKGMGNINTNLEGVLSPDVLSQIGRGAAAWGITSGTGGATGDSIGGARALRNLGQTSQQRQDLGLQQLNTMLGGVRSAATAPLFQPLQASYNPYADFQNQLYNAKVAAAPDPGAAGSAAAQMALAESLLSIYGGGGKTGMTSPQEFQSNYGSVPMNYNNDYGNELNVGRNNNYGTGGYGLG